MAKKIHIQLAYSDKETFWTLSNNKKRYGGVVEPNEYQNYLCEKIAIKCSYDPIHGTLEEISRVTDLNRNIRYVTYTLKIK